MARCKCCFCRYVRRENAAHDRVIKALEDGVKACGGKLIPAGPAAIMAEETRRKSAKAKKAKR